MGFPMSKVKERQSDLNDLLGRARDFGQQFARSTDKLTKNRKDAIRDVQKRMDSLTSATEYLRSMADRLPVQRRQPQPNLAPVVAVSVLAGIIIGAAGMYIFDPRVGQLRRARAAATTQHLVQRTGTVASEQARHLGERARDVAQEVKTRLGGEESGNGSGQTTAAQSPG